MPECARILVMVQFRALWCRGIVQGSKDVGDGGVVLMLCCGTSGSQLCPRPCREVGPLRVLLGLEQGRTTLAALQ